MKFIHSSCLALMGGISLSLSAQTAIVTSQANRVAEISFQAEKSRSNPYLEIELDVVFTDPEGRQKTVPAFWAGGRPVESALRIPDFGHSPLSHPVQR